MISMHSLLFSGVLDLRWWSHVLIALALTHITIVSVTVYLHRHQAHRAIDLHPVASHFFRFWLWLTTGMVTKEWAAVHRKHHARVETCEDPHSPQVAGINRVLWGGVFLYVKARSDPRTLARYGHGTPDDWIERNLYSRFSVLGLGLMGLTDVLLLGIVPGTLILVAQIAWIPFWAAGVINGVGHYWGYRNWFTRDASRNIVPVGIFIGGEELHNNHHAYPTSAKFSGKWYEFDVGWAYIRLLEALGLATIKHVAPVPRFTAPKTSIGLETLQAVVLNRHDVLVRYARSIKRIYAEEFGKLRQVSPEDAKALKIAKPWMHVDEEILPEAARARLDRSLAKSSALQTMVSMRRELIALWSRSQASREDLVSRLRDWCRRAEASGIGPLAEFSRQLRRYA